MAILIKPSGKSIQVFPKDGSHRFTLEELQSLVDGFVEPIAIQGNLNEGECPYLLGNQEGRLLHLPVNEDASDKAKVVLVGDILHLTPEEWHQSIENSDDRQYLCV